MPSPNENWYEHLVAQSRNDNIYTLIHHYLEPDWLPNHDVDFVTVRRNQLPEHLKSIPAKHISKKLPQQQYCFPGNDYVLLHNYHLTEYLQYAKWAKVIEDFEGREFIELLYEWTEEGRHSYNYPLVYYGKMQLSNSKPATLPIQFKPPESEEEEALLKAYDLLQKGEQKEQALNFAETGKIFLDAQVVTVNENSAEALQQVARRMMSYNIVAMVYAWNDQINKAAAVDALYIHYPPIWGYLESYLQPYCEMLMIKKQQDYLNYLFSDKEFRRYFLAHYEAFISLFVNPEYELTRMGEVLKIINRINNDASHK